VRVDLQHTADAIDLVRYLEQRGLDARLVPLKRGTSLEVSFDERVESAVSDWLETRHPTLAENGRRS